MLVYPILDSGVTITSRIVPYTIGIDELYIRTFLSVDANTFCRFLGDDAARVLQQKRRVVREVGTPHPVDCETVEIVGGNSLTFVLKRLHPSTVVHPSTSQSHLSVGRPKITRMMTTTVYALVSEALTWTVSSISASDVHPSAAHRARCKSTKDDDDDRVLASETQQLMWTCEEFFFVLRVRFTHPCFIPAQCRTT